MISGSLERGVVAPGGRLEQARGCQRQVAVGSTCLGSSSAGQPSALDTPASTDDVGIGDARMRGVTFAKRGRWEESGLGGSALDPLVGALKEDKMDSSSPRHTARITTRLTRQRQARAAQASKIKR